MVKRAGDAVQRVAEVLELPKEIIMDTPRMTIIGNIQLNIENHRGIIEYDNCKIRINTKIGIIKITGSDLIIKNILPEEIVITGEIENVDISS